MKVVDITVHFLDAERKHTFQLQLSTQAEVADLRKEVAKEVGKVEEEDSILLLLQDRVLVHLRRMLGQALGGVSCCTLNARFKTAEDSFVESLLYRSWDVKCQSDPDMSALSCSADGKIGSNQCSWCAAVFLSKGDDWFVQGTFKKCTMIACEKEASCVPNTVISRMERTSTMH